MLYCCHYLCIFMHILSWYYRDNWVRVCTTRGNVRLKYMNSCVSHRLGNDLWQAPLYVISFHLSVWVSPAGVNVRTMPDRNRIEPWFPITFACLSPILFWIFRTPPMAFGSLSLFPDQLSNNTNRDTDSLQTCNITSEYDFWFACRQTPTSSDLFFGPVCSNTLIKLPTKTF